MFVALWSNLKYLIMWYKANEWYCIRSMYNKQIKYLVNMKY